MNKTLYFNRIDSNLNWRIEDAYATSGEFPIFSIADGVTIPEYPEKKSPTPPRIIADIFCKKTIEYLSLKYPSISEKEICDAYNYANVFIKDFYLKNKTEFDRGTTGCVVFRDKDYILGSRFLDAGFAVLRAGEIIFKTPEFWSWQKENNSGKRSNYINLIEDLSPHIQIYKVEYKIGDILILYTDGFEKQLNLKDFINLFKEDRLNLIQKKLEQIDKHLSILNPKDYGDERSLLVVRL